MVSAKYSCINCCDNLNFSISKMFYDIVFYFPSFFNKLFLFIYLFIYLFLKCKRYPPIGLFDITSTQLQIVSMSSYRKGKRKLSLASLGNRSRIQRDILLVSILSWEYDNIFENDKKCNVKCIVFPRKQQSLSTIRLIDPSVHTDKNQITNNQDY